MNEQILAGLFSLQDPGYRAFQSRLIPTVDPDSIIGVRTPALRKYAKELAKNPEVSLFLSALPHAWFDENQLHAFLISEEKDFDACVREVNRFLPYIDNWATCDQLSPRVFRKHRAELLPQIQIWLRSNRTYTIRFGIRMLMQHYLDDRFDPAYPELVAGIRSEEYYVNTMIAWYFSTALAKQYAQIVPYFETTRLDPWAHNKAIQKAVESFRITAEQKTYLRGLKR